MKFDDDFIKSSFEVIITLLCVCIGFLMGAYSVKADVYISTEQYSILTMDGGAYTYPEGETCLVENEGWSNNPTIDNQRVHFIYNQDNFRFGCTPNPHFARSVNTDNNGNVSVEITNERVNGFHMYKPRYDWTVGNENLNKYYIRIDFLIKWFPLSLGSSSNDISTTNLTNYLKNFEFSPRYASTNCNIMYGWKGDPNTWGVSCLVLPNKDFDFYLVNNNPLDVPVSTSNINYYNMQFGFYMTDMVWEWSLNVLDLNQLVDSPTGSAFNDVYEIIQSNSTFFTTFDTNNFNGLTSIVTAPLSLISHLNSESQANLVFTIFNKEIILPSGRTLFWDRAMSKFKTIHVGSYTCNARCSRSLLTSFRNIWANIFGGFLLYLTLKKLFNVCLSLVDPSRDEVVLL